MGNDFFRFKQFVVRQSGASMKVGVDSVLLGAWTEADHVSRILDVGSGTGLLALMMAQRYAEALIDAVEIDREACQQADENVGNSAWSNRIRVICADFADYVEDCPFRYDLIISNPPYFTASLKPQDKKRDVARHNDSLPHSLLLAGSSKLLAPVGVLAVVLPPAEAMSFIDKAATCNLLVKRTLHVQTVPSKPAYRILVELSKTPPFTLEASPENRLCIEKADRSDFTNAYKELTKDFYLKF
jgi:tRNA1Val (adenine37-N6)-methyltransferase